MGTTIFARCVLGAVRIEHCEDCRIFLGPCSTSVYLDSITRGCIFITSHQLRIHKCVGLHLYVKVNGHPIIEDCKEMCFAPYRVAYAGFGQDLKSAKLEDAKCWDNVVDFRWHRTTLSPNWRVLDAKERTVYEVVKGKEGETVWGIAPEEHNAPLRFRLLGFRYLLLYHLLPLMTMTMEILRKVMMNCSGFARNVRNKDKNINYIAVVLELRRSCRLRSDRFFRTSFMSPTLIVLLPNVLAFSSSSSGR